MLLFIPYTRKLERTKGYFFNIARAYSTTVRSIIGLLDDSFNEEIKQPYVYDVCS